MQQRRLKDLVPVFLVNQTGRSNSLPNKTSGFGCCWSGEQERTMIVSDCLLCPAAAGFSVSASYSTVGAPWSYPWRPPAQLAMTLGPSCSGCLWGWSLTVCVILIKSVLVLVLAIRGVLLCHLRSPYSHLRLQDLRVFLGQDSVGDCFKVLWRSRVSRLISRMYFSNKVDWKT